MRELTKQSREIQRSFDPGAQMAAAQTQMAAAQELMAHQTRAASAAVSGVPAVGLVSAVHEAGGMLNMQPMLDIDVTVMRDGMPPHPVTVRQVVPPVFMDRIVVGAQVALMLDPGDASTAWLDFTR